MLTEPLREHAQDYLYIRPKNPRLLLHYISSHAAEEKTELISTSIVSVRVGGGVGSNGGFVSFGEKKCVNELQTTTLIL